MEEGFYPDLQIPIEDPESGQVENFGLSVRPFARECLKFANRYFEVGIFTASREWFAQ
jgi:hypothetical protein